MKLLEFILLIGAVACAEFGGSDKRQICDSSPDKECVRNFFSKTSHCEVITDVNEHPHYKGDHPVFIPVANLTVITRSTRSKNLDGEIEQFFIDEKSRSLVMAVNFKELVCSAPEAIHVISQRGQEPITFVEPINATFPTVLTAVIPFNKDGMVTEESLAAATYSAYFPEDNAEFTFGPKYTNSEDPNVAASFEELVKNRFLALKQVFRTKSMYYFLVYLQNFICDFDVMPSLGNEYDTTVLDNILQNSDENEPFTELCEEGEDLNSCAFEYFDDIGSCSPAHKPTDEPVFRKMFNIRVPWLNFTAELDDVEVTGLKGNVEKFYLNNNNLVMSVNFETIINKSPSVTLVIHQRGDLPKTVTDYNTDYYPVVLTACIPLNEGLTPEALHSAHISAYFPKSTVSYDIGPEQFENEDPEIASIMSSLSKDPMTLAEEIFVTESYNMFLAYLQKYVCDFGVPLDLNN